MESSLLYILLCTLLNKNPNITLFRNKMPWETLSLSISLVLIIVACYSLKILQTEFGLVKGS